jgi:cellulose synthase/poly-beta-1,6-N-acetylglucosamine synthase-like glycosyltransferase
MHLAAWSVFVAVQAIAVLLFATGAATFATLVKGCFVLRRMARAGRQDYSAVILKSPLVPAVSTIAVPPDASAESRQFTRRLLDLHFGRNEVVIVLDGPSEAALETWSREFHLCVSTRSVGQDLATAPVRGVYESRDPVRVVVIDKERGGALDAWNAGVNAATSPVIGLLDPASEFQPDVLLRLIQPMLESAEETIAVSGGVCAPAAPGLAGQFGALESLRAWLTRGAAFAGRNLTMPFPGCALLARRSSILQAGGFTGGALELFLRLHALALAAGKSYRIAFLPEPVSYSRPPGTFAGLRLQTQRDQSEIAHAFRHRVAVAGPFGWPAMRSLYYVRFVRPCLEMTAYVLAVFGLLMGWVDIFTALLVLLATVGMGMVLSMAAVVLREVAAPNAPDERRMAALFRAAIRENLGYRQVRNLWLIAGFRQRAGPRQQDRGSTAHGRPSAASAAAK